jgi:hypothetical protein
MQLHLPPSLSVLHPQEATMSIFAISSPPCKNVPGTSDGGADFMSSLIFLSPLDGYVPVRPSGEAQLGSRLC